MKRTRKYAVTTTREHPFYGRWYLPKASLRAAIAAARRRNIGLVAGCRIREETVDEKDVSFVLNIKSGREWHIYTQENV